MSAAAVIMSGYRRSCLVLTLADLFAVGVAVGIMWREHGEFNAWSAVALVVFVAYAIYAYRDFVRFRRAR